MNKNAYSGGIPMEIIYLIMISFCEGLIIPAKTAFLLICRDAHNAELSDFNYVDTVSTALVILKPVYGYLSDNLPIFGQKRKPYLILSSFTALMATLMIGLNQLLGLRLNTIIYAFLAIEISNNCRTVVGDAISVETRRYLVNHPSCQTGIFSNSVYVMLWSKHIGTFISFSFLLLRQEYLGSLFFLFYFMAALCTFAVTCTMKEVGTPPQAKAKNFVKEVIDSCKIIVDKKILLPLIGSMIILAAPNIQILFTFFLKDVLVVSNKQVTMKELIGKLCAFFAISSRTLLFKNFDRNRLLQLTSVCNLLALVAGMILIKVIFEYSLFANISVFIFFFAEAYTTELRNIPLIETFADCSPKSSDGFFLSVLGCAISISKTLSKALGTYFTSFWHIKKTNFSQGYKLILASLAIGAFGFCVLLIDSVITSRQNKKEAEEEQLAVIKNEVVEDIKNE